MFGFEDKSKKKPMPTGGKGAERKGQPGAKGPTGVTPPTKIGSGSGKVNKPGKDKCK